jgi:hypothetical protein
MGINYLEGIKPGDKIDVSAWQKPDKTKKLGGEPRLENYLPDLKRFLSQQAEEVNQEFSGFLDKEGKIAIVGEEAKSHEHLVATQEEAFSQEAGKNLIDWRRDKEKNPASLTEMALTVMLHKFLKDHFIVARSSSFDDYNNGVDQVLVYKETGEVVCGIDEVAVNPSDKDGGAKKAVKLGNIMAKGGAHIKYGAKLDNGQLVRAEVKNIPAFYMSLGRDELGELLASIKQDQAEISAVEEKIFSRLIESLESQTKNFNLNDELKLKTLSALEKLRLGFKTKKLAA